MNSLDDELDDIFLTASIANEDYSLTDRVGESEKNFTRKIDFESASNRGKVATTLRKQDHASEIKFHEDDQDFKLALKLSKELNSSPADRSAVSWDTNFKSSFPSSNDTLSRNNLNFSEKKRHQMENDYEFALKLSKELNSRAENCAPRSSDNVSELKNELFCQNNGSLGTAIIKNVGDFGMASKSSRKLNSSPFKNDHRTSGKNPRNSCSANFNTAGGRENSDYLLAVQLSQANYHSPSKKSTNRNISLDSDYDDDDANADDSEIKILKTNAVDSDYLLAVQLSRDNTPSKLRKARMQEKKNENVTKYLNKDMSVVHPDWETIDPNPDIYSLFIAFNKRFFWSKLDMVEVKWSPRMTLCAGICSYQRRAGHCTVKLSKPLLQFRPRKDLVETLLHEMIHAYLFVTSDDRDRDGHGPRFHSHMYRINKESGANITVYHSFHDEVRYLKNHEWRCNGPCRQKAPFYGYVRRSVNRAPGPYDNWWSDHRATCGGDFIKISEPEEYTKKKASIERKKKLEAKNKLDNYFQVLPSSSSKLNTTSLSLPVTDGTMVMAAKTSATSSASATSTYAIKNNIFTLSDLVKNERNPNPTKSSSGSRNKWAPLPANVENLLNFIDSHHVYS